MNEFLASTALIALVAMVTSLLIAGVIRLVVAADRSGRTGDVARTADRPSRAMSSPPHS